MTICLKEQHQTSLATVLQRRPTPVYCMFIRTYPFSCQSYSKRNIYHSLIIKQLIELGMSPLAQTAAFQNLPLAGRVSHFIKNWEIITQDPWVLNCVKGYTCNKPTEQASPIYWAGRQPRLFNTGPTNTGMHRGTGLVGDTPDQV